MYCISKTQPIAQGNEKWVYQHPENPDLLIKIWKDPSASRQNVVFSMIRRYRRLRKYRVFLNEIIEHLFIREKNDEIKYLQQISGIIETDLGVGLVVKATRKRNGQLASTLSELLATQELTDVQKQNLQTLSVWMANSNIIYRDISTKNLVWDELQNTFVIIDGIGTGSGWSLRKYMTGYNALRNRKKINKLLTRVATLTAKFSKTTHSKSVSLKTDHETESNRSEHRHPRDKDTVSTFSNVSSKNIPIQIITLNPNSPNVQELQRQLTDQHLESTCVMGIDGRKGIPELQPDETVNQTQSLKMNLVQMTSTEIGCYLSHLRAIKEAYAAGIERLCLLEDDILIEPAFSEILTEIATLPERIEFVRLMGLKVHKRKLTSRLGRNHLLIRPTKGICGTQGYVIHRKGMEKVIAKGCTICEPIDKFFDHYWTIPLKCYGVEPHVIWERPRSSTTVNKQSRRQASQPLNKCIQKHAVKLFRGIHRRIYILRNWREFILASRPSEKPGRTERIH